MSNEQLALAPAVGPEDREKVDRGGRAVVASARALSVRSQKEYEGAASFLRDVIRVGLKKIDVVFDANIKRWHEGHKQAIKEKKEHAEPWLEAERLVSNAMGQWEDEVRRVLEAARREEEARARAAEEAAIKRAEELEAVGKAAEADAALDAVETPKPVAVAVTSPRAAGVSVRVLPRFEIVNIAEIKREFLVPDMAAIQKVVTAKGKDAEEVVGGIRYVEMRSRVVKS